MPIRTESWSLEGAEGKPILVSSDIAEKTHQARASVLFAHGFKGYKDYGFIPILAARLAESISLAVHRFNFSHSGMTNDVSTFARPDLFERDTWNKQTHDLNALFDHVASGEAPGSAVGSPILLMGHSRGGAACLLMAGRRFRDGAAATPDAVVTIAAPDQTNNLAPQAVDLLRTQGYIVSPSARTGQTLRIRSTWLQEQEAAPENHDILGLCAKIQCPVLAAHGAEDATVTAECARRIAQACPRGELHMIPGANHVMNTPNPADPQAPPPDSLQLLLERILQFIRAVTR